MYSAMRWLVFRDVAAGPPGPGGSAADPVAAFTTPHEDGQAKYSRFAQLPVQANRRPAP